MMEAWRKHGGPMSVVTEPGYGNLATACLCAASMAWEEDDRAVVLVVRRRAEADKATAFLENSGANVTNGTVASWPKGAPPAAGVITVATWTLMRYRKDETKATPHSIIALTSGTSRDNERALLEDLGENAISWRQAGEQPAETTWRTTLQLPSTPDERRRKGDATEPI